MQQALERGAVRDVVVALAPLFLHDLALDVELLLRERGEEEAHAVRLQPEPEREIVRREGLEVIRAIEERRAVEHAAHRLHVAEVLVVADVLRAGEEHVLEQMREAGAAGAFVLRADVIPEVDGHQRRGVVLVEDDAEAVGEFVVGERKHGRRLLPQTMNDEG